MIREDRIASSATRCALRGTNVVAIGSQKAGSAKIIESTEGLTNHRTLRAAVFAAALDDAAALTSSSCNSGSRVTHVSALVSAVNVGATKMTPMANQTHCAVMQLVPYRPTMQYLHSSVHPIDCLNR